MARRTTKYKTGFTDAGERLPAEMEDGRVDDRDTDEGEQIAQHRTLNASVQRRVDTQRRRQVHFEQPRLQLVVHQNVESVQLC